MVGWPSFIGVYDVGILRCTLLEWGGLICISVFFEGKESFS